VKVESSTRLLVTTPRHLAGAVNVTVVTGHGDSAAVKADRFSFAAPAEAITWGPWKQVLGGGTGTVSALGCLTATDCFGWDVNGNNDTVLVRWNGSTWSGPTDAGLASPPRGAIADTSCPTKTFCMTVGARGGPGLPAPSAYVYSGGHWTATKPNGSEMEHVSCASPTFCAATDEIGDVSEYNGKTWSKAVDVGDTLYAGYNVSCASADFCVLTTATDAIVIWNGTSWKQTAAALPGATGELAVSCVSSAWCLAVTQDGQVYRYAGASWSAAGDAGTGLTDGTLVCTSQTFCLVGVEGGKVDRFDGAAWTLSPALVKLGDLAFGAPDLSCVGRSCVAVAQGPSQTIANTFTGGRWAGQKFVDSSGGLFSLDCPTTSFCAAMGPTANTYTASPGMYVDTWQHGAWTAPGFLATGDLPLGHTGDQGEALSCTSATFCLADVLYGPVWRYNGHTWTVTTSPPTASPGITGLSCASATFCVATVTPTTNSKNQPTSSGVDVFNGSRWTAVKSWAKDTGRWQYSTCTSASFCLLADYFGHLAVFNGKSWRQIKGPQNMPTSESYGRGGISCTSATFCMMSTYNDRNAYPDPSGVEIYNGRSWTYHYLVSGGAASGGLITQVTCAPHTRFCLAWNYAGREFSYDGFQWSRIAATNIRGANITCASRKLCLATNGSSFAIGT
jgi:hypothetical protein